MDPWSEFMRRGDFAAAWRISDAILRERSTQPCFDLPRHQQWIWNGQSIANKRVLIRCYHGLGDTVQFVRYAPLVRALARHVTVWAQPALIGVLRGAPGIDCILPLHDGEVGTPYDIDVEVMEMSHLFRTTLATIPNAVPYLHAPDGATASIAALEREVGHVGLAWEAGDWDQRRSVPLALLQPLFDVPGVIFHALQRGPALAHWSPGFGPVSGSDNVADTARLLNTLDLIVTVDSFPAHLAGAFGRPVWTLLQKAADWRWLEDRDDSPWYPTMRLFRQDQPGEWEPVVARLAAELRRFSAAVVQARASTGLAGA